ncbi:hypothetical protein [Streptomyces sp. NPDC127020]|uniref:hypothetical protein n=1 Tax=Streptomyces sp. NPDC127020 TaxID=3347109 RepID=UPI003662E382
MAQQVAVATAELQAIQQNGTRPSTVRIRDEFFYAKKGRRPSISNILAPRGVNTQIYLLLLFEAQCRKRTGIAGPSSIPLFPEDPEDVSWDKIVVSQAKDNSHGKSRTTARQNKIRQIKSAFQRLHQENLVRVSDASAGKPSIVTPLHEAGVLARGGAYEYTISNGSKGSVGLPVSFFTKGWIYCLTPSEVHLYLALLHLQRRNYSTHWESGIFCAGNGRSQDYGISRDVYESHLMLSRFKLITKIQSPIRHDDGKVRAYAAMQERGIPLPAHRFRVNPPTGFMGEAAERVASGIRQELRQRSRTEALANENVEAR